MEKLAYINGDVFLYWNSIVLTLAAATAICFFLAFYLGKSGNAAAAFGAVPLCLVLSIVAARFFHWYSRADSYDGFLAAMTDHSSGGYALMGVFLGCFLAALVLRMVCLHRNLPEMLDCMCLAGSADGWLPFSILPTGDRSLPPPGHCPGCIPSPTRFPEPRNTAWLRSCCRPWWRCSCFWH